VTVFFLLSHTVSEPSEAGEPNISEPTAVTIGEPSVEDEPTVTRETTVISEPSVVGEPSEAGEPTVVGETYCRQ